MQEESAKFQEDQELVTWARFLEDRGRAELSQVAFQLGTGQERAGLEACRSGRELE